LPPASNARARYSLKTAAMEINDLYRDVILDHNRRPRNFGVLEPADASVEGFNPMCGDRLTVRLKMNDDKISDIRFEGQGCAISTASASLMTEAVKGRTRTEALRLFDRVHELLTDDAAPPADELGKLAALSGVREYPARVKCASLCWHTLASALRSSDPQVLPTVTTE
jgi:nitrogen fixation protein NifU and related proteins